MSDADTARKGAAGLDWDAARRPTINDIARLAEVSKKTVSRVINQSPFVKADTRDKVNAIINELGYEPDPQARGLAFRRSFLIGLIYDNPNPQYVIDMQRGVLDVIRGLGFELLVHPCNRQSEAFLQDIRVFVERQKLFGVILPPSVSEDERVVKLLKDIDCPYVRIAGVPLDSDDAMVVTNDFKGGYAAAKHLAELGHVNVAHISGPDLFRSAHERRAGFEAGLAEHGLVLSTTMSVRGAYTYESGRDQALALLQQEGRPTAIFTGNDEMAAGVYDAARHSGLSIPQDLSVVGYDDTPLASRLWPPLTTVNLPVREVGKNAATKLITERDKEAKAKAKMGEFEPQLVVRSSTARRS